MGWLPRWPMGHGSHGSWVKSSMGHLGHGSLWVTHSLLCGAPQKISTGFASWLHYCTDVAQRRSAKLCTMFGHLLGRYNIYTFSGALGPWRNFATFKIHCVQVLRSPILAVTARQFAALSRGRHLHSAGQPSRWALAHIVVVKLTVPNQ